MLVSLKTGTADILCILCHWFVSFYDDGLDKWINYNGSFIKDRYSRHFMPLICHILRWWIGWIDIMVVSLKTGTADILCHWFVTFCDDGLAELMVY